MSKSRHWFRCFPANYLEGVRGMSDELAAAYTRIFMKIYDVGGPLPNDDQSLKHVLCKRPQDARRIVGQLVALGKITLTEGFIHNPRADAEITWMNGKWSANDRSNGASYDGEMEPHLASHNPKKSNENHARAHDHPRGSRAPGIQKPDKEGSAPPPAERAAPPSKVSSLRPDEPPEERASVARDLGLTPPARSQAPEPTPPRKAPTRMANSWDVEKRFPPGPQPLGETKFLKAWREANGDFTKLPTKHSAPRQPLRPADDEALMDKTNKRFGPSKPPPGTTLPKKPTEEPS